MAGIAFPSRAELDPRIECEPFILRLGDEGSSTHVVDYLKRNWGRFRTVMPTDSADYFSESVWERKLQDFRNEFQAGQSLRLFLFHPSDCGRIVGDISYTNVVAGAFRACNLGCKIDAEFEGRGVMSRALIQSNDYAFRRFALHRIMANYVPTNERSGRLLRKLGFVIEGYARDYLHLDGQWRDHILTSLTKP